MPIKPTKPKFEDREGSMRLAIFKNKNANNNTYPLICITAVRFPFKYCKKIYINPNEAKKLQMLLERMPKIEKKSKREVRNGKTNT